MSRLTAVVIDDAFLPPTAVELNKYGDGILDLLAKNPATAEWFLKEFPTDADVESQGFLDEFFANIDHVARFWSIRHQSPLGTDFGLQAFPALETEVNGNLAPLLEIVEALGSLGYAVKTFGALPAESADQDYIKSVNLIVIDHFLGTPSEGDAVVAPTIEYFVQLFGNAWQLEHPLTPYFLLVSTVDIATNDRATDFRKRLNVSESMFRFAQKSAKLEKSPLSAIKAFHRDRDVLVEYSRFHAKYRSSLSKTFSEVIAAIAQLELMDLAAINVGQLHGEKESLSSYLNWLIGQYLTNKLETDNSIFLASGNLPTTIESSLVGHLGPSNRLSHIFSRISLNMPASQAHYRSLNRPVQIRFGDVFKISDGESAELIEKDSPKARKRIGLRTRFSDRHTFINQRSRTKVIFKKKITTASNNFRCVLLISQTCDVIHHKLKNDQILFVEGTATEIPSGDRSTMFWETAKQIGLLAQNGMLIVHEKKYYRLSWDVHEIRTMHRSAIERYLNDQYLGRLNELFALQIQRAALDHLGRVGLPIKPAQTLAFTRCEISASFGDQILVKKKESLCWAILRIEKNPQIKLSGAFTQPFIDWVHGVLDEFKTEDLHNNLRKKIDELQPALQPFPKASQWIIQPNEVKPMSDIHNIDIKLGLKDESGNLQKFPGNIRLEFEGFKSPPSIDKRSAVISFTFSKEQVIEDDSSTNFL